MHASAHKLPPVAQRRALKIGWLLLTLALGGTWLFVVSWFALNPLLFWWETSSWEPVPCEIVQSATRKVRQGRSQYHALEVEFTYERAGNRYTAERFHAMTTSPIARVKEARSTAKRLKQIEDPVCYVDPDNPERAVLDRSTEPIRWVTLLFFLPLVGLCGAGFVLTSLWFTIRVWKDLPIRHLVG